jgi:hypothetical protein
MEFTAIISNVLIQIPLFTLRRATSARPLRRGGVNPRIYELELEFLFMPNNPGKVKPFSGNRV